MKLTVKEAIKTLRAQLDQVEDSLSHTDSIEAIIEIARRVRATKNVLDHNSNQQQQHQS